MPQGRAVQWVPDRSRHLGAVMHKARAFFYVSAGIFLLTLSYHLGARSAGAQAPGNAVVATFGNLGAVVTANGDVYSALGPCSADWHLCGNVFGGPVPAQRQTFGALKSRYRGAPGAAQPAPQDR